MPDLGCWGNHLLISTLTGATEVAANPIAYRTPYSGNICHPAPTLPISPIASALITAPVDITVRMLCRSINRPTIGMANAETSMNSVSADDSAERLNPKSSVIGSSASPNAKRVPVLKNSIANPVARTT